MQAQETTIDPEKFAETLVSAMQAATDLMEQELLYLNDRDYANMAALRQKKFRLLQEISHHDAALRGAPLLLKQTAAATQAAIKKTSAAFYDAASRNEKALKAAVTATRSLLHTVIDAVRNENKRSECYVDTRKDPFMIGAYNQVCPPVAVSRVV